jgi:hypothetical protein
MIRILLSMLLCAALLFTVACKKEGISLINTGLRDVPSDKKGAFKWIKDVNRGQLVRILDEQVDGEWMKVQLSDGTTDGWILKSNVHKGKKQVIEFSETARLYDQPDIESKLRSSLPAGSKALVLKKKDRWYYISVGANMQGWVKGGSFKEGTDTKVQTQNEIEIPGLGKCVVEASSSLPDSDGFTFGVKNLFDRDPGTTWQAGNGGIGEWVEITFPRPMTIRVAMINGFVKVDKKFAKDGSDGDLYVLNNRVKSMKVEYWGVPGRRQNAMINFADETRDYQDAGTYRNAARIRFIIDSVYKGKKWNDVALGEILIEMQQ